MNPVFPPARALEVERLLERERHEEARSRALSALEATPEAPDVLAALAASHFLAGEMAEVKELEARFSSLRGPGTRASTRDWQPRPSAGASIGRRCGTLAAPFFRLRSPPLRHGSWG